MKTIYIIILNIVFLTEVATAGVSYARNGAKISSESRALTYNSWAADAKVKLTLNNEKITTIRVKNKETIVMVRGTIYCKVDNQKFIYEFKDTGSLEYTLYHNTDKGATGYNKPEMASGTWQQEGRYLKLYMIEYGEFGKQSFHESTIQLAYGEVTSRSGAKWANGDSEEFNRDCGFSIQEKGK